MGSGIVFKCTIIEYGRIHKLTTHTEKLDIPAALDLAIPLWRLAKSRIGARNGTYFDTSFPVADLHFVAEGQRRILQAHEKREFRGGRS